jgi:rhodanese-related sulfurtransferase
MAHVLASGQQSSCRRMFLSVLINYCVEDGMVKKILIMIPALLLLCVTAAMAAGESYMDADAFKAIIENQEPVIIADIQKPKDFQKHQFYGSIETSAYPVKTEEQQQLLDPVIEMFEKTGNRVILVGPRGTSAAKRAYKYLLEQSIPQDKLFILKGGIKEWPYKELFIDVAGGCA